MKLQLLPIAYQSQTFTLTPDGIIKKGVANEADRISEILVDNPMDKEILYNGQPGMFIGGTGITGASVAAMSVGANLAAGTMVHASQAISRSAAETTEPRPDPLWVQGDHTRAQPQAAQSHGHF